MSAATRHRGPDGHGVVVGTEKSLEPKRLAYQHEQELVGEFERALSFLGHHRLAIIDLSERASQPFISSDSRSLLSFNGEIYNYIELRADLEKRGHRFKTDSDTEVLLASFLEWGEESFGKLNGDFAFCLWDQARAELYLVRDRTGIKPLFYCLDAKGLSFSSEVKGVIAGEEAASWVLNQTMAYHYLVADFPQASALEASFVEGIQTLAPGHFLRLSLKDFSVRKQTYWEYGKSETRQSEQAVEGFAEIFRDAVKIRTRSDVGLSSFLSGGLDSSSLVAMASEFVSPLETFSASFKGTQWDESEQIEKLSQHFGTQSHLLDFRHEDFEKDIEKIVRIQDQPFMTLNVYSQFKNIEGASKQKHRVVLDGGGADEYLAGYADYLLPAFADGLIDEKLLKSHEEERFKSYVNLSSQELYEASCREELRRVNYIQDEWRSRFRTEDIDRPLPLNFKRQEDGSFLKAALKDSVSSSWMNKNLIWDNRYLDLSGMALGVELRVPFQDFRLIDFCAQLSPKHMIHNRQTKRILREAMQTKLPKQTLEAQEKIGFVFPFCEMMRERADFYQFFVGLTKRKSFQDLSPFVDRSQVISELEEIREGRSYHYNIWRVFNLQLFVEQTGISVSS